VAFVIGMMLANIPEGLPALLVIALGLAGKRMASRGCLPLNLSAVHSIGKRSTAF
jgi:sodium/potassium-transporting ATPase subunit alpha